MLQYAVSQHQTEISTHDPAFSDFRDRRDVGPLGLASASKAIFQRSRPWSREDWSRFRVFGRKPRVEVKAEDLPHEKAYFNDRAANKWQVLRSSDIDTEVTRN